MLIPRTNPDLVNLSNINNLVIPPLKSYPFFKAAKEHPFKANARHYSQVNAWWLAEFATLIYDTEVNVKNQISELSSHSVRWISNEGTHTQCCVAEFNDFTVVSFRGTELVKPAEIPNFEKINNFVQDLLTDANVGMTELRGVKVHKGILDALNSVWNQLHSILKNTANPIWFTGHSLGGALAMLAAFKMEDSIDKVGGVYTIGCPAIGGSGFKEMYNNQLKNKTFHHVYGEDIVSSIGQIVGKTSGVLSIQQVGNTKKLPRVDINFVEEFKWLLQMPLIDHGPIFYMNSLWNNMQE